MCLVLDMPGLSTGGSVVFLSGFVGFVACVLGMHQYAEFTVNNHIFPEGSDAEEAFNATLTKEVVFFSSFNFDAIIT